MKRRENDSHNSSKKSPSGRLQTICSQQKRPEGNASGRFEELVAGARSHLYRTVMRT